MKTVHKQCIADVNMHILTHVYAGNDVIAPWEKVRKLITRLCRVCCILRWITVEMIIN